MPSNALQLWRAKRAEELDQIAHAHLLIGGGGPGRRYATQQINQAYCVLLSSHFQGFCRDLHDEAINQLVNGVANQGMQGILRKVLQLGRKLDVGNPNGGNIGSDFNRFGLAFWDEVRNHDKRNDGRKAHLEDMNEWRNAVAHQDIDPAKLGGTLCLARIETWRGACNGLAQSFDRVMRCQIYLVTGITPW